MKTFVVAVSLALAGANSVQAQVFRPSVGTGAVVGAVAGGLIGGHNGDRWAQGAVIGAAAGALIGAAVAPRATVYQQPVYANGPSYGQQVYGTTSPQVVYTQSIPDAPTVPDAPMVVTTSAPQVVYAAPQVVHAQPQVVYVQSQPQVVYVPAPAPVFYSRPPVVFGFGYHSGPRYAPVYRSGYHHAPRYIPHHGHHYRDHHGHGHRPYDRPSHGGHSDHSSYRGRGR